MIMIGSSSQPITSLNGISAEAPATDLEKKQAYSKQGTSLFYFLKLIIAKAAASLQGLSFASGLEKYRCL